MLRRCLLVAAALATAACSLLAGRAAVAADHTARVAVVRHEYHNIRAKLVDKQGGKAEGSVHIVCNAGVSPDRVIVKASGLKPHTKYHLFFLDAKSQKRGPVGFPPDATTDDNGGLRFEQEGHLCPVGQFTQLLILDGTTIVMTADVTPQP